MSELNSYNLSRSWFNFCFENPERISPNHTALYFFAIEQCNRLGWKEKFGLPTTMAKEAIGIRSYNTYIKTLQDLVEFGFINMIEVSKNQYSSNIVALSYFDKALDKALDKAFIKHATKQSESTGESIDSIDKQVNNETSKQANNEPLNTIEFRKSQFVDLLKPFHDKYPKEMMNEFYRYWVLPTKKQPDLMAFEKEKTFDASMRLATWFKKSNGKTYPNQKVKEQLIDSWTKKFKIAFSSSKAKDNGIDLIIASLSANIQARAPETASNDIDIGVVNMWNVILQKWETLDPFLTKQVSFDSIARNFDNILIQMNGTGIGTKSKATIDLTQIRRP